MAFVDVAGAVQRHQRQGARAGHHVGKAFGVPPPTHRRRRRRTSRIFASPIRARRLSGPAGLPKEVVATLDRAVAEIMNETAMKDALGVLYFSRRTCRWRRCQPMCRPSWIAGACSCAMPPSSRTDAMLYQAARNPRVPSGFGLAYRPPEIGGTRHGHCGRSVFAVGNKNGILLARADEVIE